MGYCLFRPNLILANAVHTHTIPDPTVQCLLALTPLDQVTDAKQYMRGSAVFMQAGPVYSGGDCQVDRRDDT